VVVVLLIALRGDIVHRCRQLGILCVEWESRRPVDQASIVLVTPESAITEDFMIFLNRQRLCYRLDRIVIDECHVVLNNQTNFRPAIAQLGRLIVA
jgi:superfamily II DNA helicase RecQ